MKTKYQEQITDIHSRVLCWDNKRTLSFLSHITDGKRMRKSECGLRFRWYQDNISNCVNCGNGIIE